MLVSPTSVTYQDGNGDTVTVTISKPLFKTATINKVFTFDTGSVNGSNSTQQQLQTLEFGWLGKAATGMDVSITVPTVNNGPVNVGYINSSGIDLGAVTVGGDLGRISVGDLSHIRLALVSLNVESLGAMGTATQAANGNLNTLVAGRVGSITVNGDIDNASIGIGGGGLGLLGSLKVTGSINGGSGGFSGCVRTQGGITNIEVDGSINGGSGPSSGTIGTTGRIGTVLVEGDVVGGDGIFSGAILSSGKMGTVKIEGNLIGGSGGNSGQIGTSSSLASVSVGRNVFGGDGLLSGTILATGNIGSVVVTESMLGGTGRSSGQIGATGNIGTVTIGNLIIPGLVDPLLINGFQGVDNGSGVFSGIITAEGSISSITINGDLQGSFTASEASPALGASIYAGHNLGNVTVATDVYDAGIVSGGDMGSIMIGGTLSGNSAIQAGKDLASIIVNSAESVTLRTPDGVIPDSISNVGPGMVLTSFTVNGSVGSIVAGASRGYNAIIGCIFHVKGDIGSITATSEAQIDTTVFGIEKSAFDAGGSIGSINSTGTIDQSIFVAGIYLGSNFGFTDAGTFNNTAAAAIGYTTIHSNTAAHIGNIVVTNGGSTALISSSTFLAGVHGPGPNGFGTMDDSVPAASSIGTIMSPGGLTGDFFESGTIGGAAAASSSVTGTTFIETA
jgi:hypothetical protein